jgi:hypothetical protein
LPSIEPSKSFNFNLEFLPKANPQNHTNYDITNDITYQQNPHPKDEIDWKPLLSRKLAIEPTQTHIPGDEGPAGKWGPFL